MGTYFSCLKYKVYPNIYKQKQITFNGELRNTEELEENNVIDFEKKKTKFFQKSRSFEDIMLVNSISPLSRHSCRKAKSMDCLFSLI